MSHIDLPHFGVDGQQRLRAASVLCVGAGGLGCAALQYVVAAGVGVVGVVDDDVVDVSNLQRQVLYGERDVGKLKVEVARARLEALNAEVEIRAYARRFGEDLLEGYDLVLDCSDNYATRCDVSDACVRKGMPNVFASVGCFEGQCAILCGDKMPCYRCLYPQQPPDHLMPKAVFGPAAGMMGVLQAAEAMKYIVGMGEPLVEKLLVVDILRMDMRVLRVSRDMQCVCAEMRR